MSDEELDRLLDGARADLPTQGELAPLRERLALGAPAPLHAPAVGPLRAPGVASGGASPAPSWLRLTGVAIAIAVLAGAWLAWPTPGSVVVPAPEEPRSTPIEIPVTPTPIEAAPPPPPADEPEMVEPAPRPSARREVPLAPAAEAAPPLPSEVVVVQRAAASLRSGDLTVAREALAEHRARFASGVLVEERESLEVELALREDGARGRARLDVFRREHPSSVHLPRIERLAARAAE